MYSIWMLASLNDWLKLYVYLMHKINKCASEITFIKSWNKKTVLNLKVLSWLAIALLGYLLSYANIFLCILIALMMSWIFIQGDVSKLPKHILDDISQRQRRYVTCKHWISSSKCIICNIYLKQWEISGKVKSANHSTAN